jgi:hypothetical protein
VAPFKLVQLLINPDTQEAVPNTVPVRPLPEESAADVPLDSLSFQWAARLEVMSWPRAGTAKTATQAAMVQNRFDNNMR